LRDEGLTILLAILVLGVYLGTLGRTVGRADTFEFQVVASKLGIAHPTGYPLYLLLGKLFTLLPVGSIAFRVNLLSAVCATGATLWVYASLRQLLQVRQESYPAIPLLGALAFAFSPTLWSQAVEAEVYALNSLFVAFSLWVLIRIFGKHARRQPVGTLVPILFFALGLSLTNHLTTVILFPPVALTLLLTRPRLHWKGWLGAGLLFVAGISIYLYLPLRWPAVHDGALMTLREFVDWVIGGRFKGALQLGAWRTDSTRYAIVGRLVLDQWGWPGVALATLGLLELFRGQWRVALITITAWLGYAFYALSFYVPDISVFLVPAHLVMAIWMGYGVGAATGLLASSNGRAGVAIVPVLATLFAILPLSLLTGHWSSLDRSTPNPLEAWGRHLLSLDLDLGAAVLADSEKIAPLYYLQQTEGLRPDLEIIVLPDEATYRTQLDARVAAGQTVYLARFLPNLEGIYHLRSVPGATGPLIEVSAHPLIALPPLDGRLDANFGSLVTLLGYTMEKREVAYPDSLCFTLYWTASASVEGVYQVWLRLVDADGRVAWQSDGAHPASDYYPTSAWRPGEIIPDARQIPWPLNLSPAEYQLQVALLVPFGSVGLIPDRQTDPWLPVATLGGRSPREIPAPTQVRRIWLDETVITGLDIAGSARPGTELPITLFVTGDVTPVEIGWSDGPVVAVDLSAPLTSFTLPAPAGNGEHSLAITREQPMRCGWPAQLVNSCPLAQVTIQGAPLPAGATNFDDLIALLSTDVVQTGGVFDVTLTWQALAPIAQDYTLFLHVLDAADRIVGQVDAWPVQGTFPTSQWLAGVPITDRYHIPIVPDAVPGAYRLEIGWYLLDTMKRLDVLAADGDAVDDRILLEGFVIR
jgi:hypothetical protein